MPNRTLDISTMNPKQALFFKSRKRYVAYGGARGGGKSWAVRYKASLLALRYGGIKILLIRRTYKDLERNHVRELVPLLEGIAAYNRQERCFHFPNGSIIELGYCAAENDILQYQGVEYDVIFIDEATQLTEYQFSVLTASVRGANNFPKRIYLTCNPGGVGHEWVKRLFVSREYEPSENPDEYEFIAATVFDNAAMLKQDKGYVDMLNNLPDGLREAWRDGNWDMLAGRYFSEFNRAVHVVEPFLIPEHWTRYRAIDYGLDCLACVWVAVSELGEYYVYREYAKSDKVISDGAADICELSQSERIEYTVAPGDLWARSQESAKSKADLFGESGLPLIKGNNNRESGWLALKELLKVTEQADGTRSARLHIFSSCRSLIEHLPALQRDSHRPTDCMTEPHNITHLPDALRYFAVQFIQPPKAPEHKSEIQAYKERVFRSMKRGKHRF